MNYTISISCDQREINRLTEKLSVAFNKIDCFSRRRAGFFFIDIKIPKQETELIDSVVKSAVDNWIDGYVSARDGVEYKE